MAATRSSSVSVGVSLSARAPASPMNSVVRAVVRLYYRDPMTFFGDVEREHRPHRPQPDKADFSLAHCHPPLAQCQVPVTMVHHILPVGSWNHSNPILLARASRITARVAGSAIQAASVSSSVS